MIARHNFKIYCPTMMLKISIKPDSFHNHPHPIPKATTAYMEVSIICDVIVETLFHIHLFDGLPFKAFRTL